MSPPPPPPHSPPLTPGVHPERLPAGVALPAEGVAGAGLQGRHGHHPAAGLQRHLVAGPAVGAVGEPAASRRQLQRGRVVCDVQRQHVQRAGGRRGRRRSC